MTTSLALLRKSLRIEDNIILNMATKHDCCFPLYIHNHNDDTGQANRLWLLHALNSFNNTLNKTLTVITGNVIEQLSSIVVLNNIDKVYVDSLHEPESNQQDYELMLALNTLGCDVEIVFQRTLWNLPLIKDSNGDNYRVFSPFYRKGCVTSLSPSLPYTDVNLATLNKLDIENDNNVKGSISEKSWTNTIIRYWDISEQGAKKNGNYF